MPRTFHSVIITLLLVSFLLGGCGYKNKPFYTNDNDTTDSSPMQDIQFEIIPENKETYDF